MAQNSEIIPPKRLYVGCAGWSVSRAALTDMPAHGSQLEKYASMFRAVEINSSFSRSHRRDTYERWAATTPPWFRFSVKAPKAVTHKKKLVDAFGEMEKFLGEIAGLGNKLGALLIQLPPGLEFDQEIARAFFVWLRQHHEGDVFLEPRHRSWFTLPANKMLYDLRLGRVAADPAVVQSAAEPGGVAGRVYFRLHGSPQVYFSSYTSSYLDGLAFRLRMHVRAGDAVWCIFDNTIRGAALTNALAVMRKIGLGEQAASIR